MGRFRSVGSLSAGADESGTVGRPVAGACGPGRLFYFCIKKTSSSAGGSESFSYTQKKEPSNIHSATAKKHYENQEVQMDEQSLAHTKWNCKYHIVLAPK